jgi:hypothetical protein
VASYEKAQELRDAWKLRGSKAALLACARPACGKFIYRECTKSLAQLESDIPSVVLSAQNDVGEPVVDVEVTMDGEPLVSRLDGRAVAVDPGVHQFGFRTQGGAVDLVRMPIAQGERNRTLLADLKTPVPRVKPAKETVASARLGNKAAEAGEESKPAQAKTPVAPAEPALGPLAPKIAPAEALPITRVALDPVPADKSGGSSIAPYLVGGIGVAGLAGFGLLYSIARNDNKSLTRCWPNCPVSQVNETRRMYIAADVSLGVGIAALGTAALWLYFDSKPSSEKPIPAPRYAIDVKPSPSGMFATVSGAF